MQLRGQPLPRLAQGFVLLGEVKTDVAMNRFAEETRAGNPGDADAFGDFLGSDAVVGEAERRDVDQRVVGALRRGEGKSGLAQVAKKDVALAAVFGKQIDVI